MWRSIAGPSRVGGGTRWRYYGGGRAGSGAECGGWYDGMVELGGRWARVLGAEQDRARGAAGGFVLGGVSWVGDLAIHAPHHSHQALECPQCSRL